MKLELKHLTSYKLGLDGIEVWDKENLEVTTIDKVDFNSGQIKTNVLNSDWQDLNTIELRLRPLSDLDKQITHNNEKIVVLWDGEDEESSNAVLDFIDCPTQSDIKGNWNYVISCMNYHDLSILLEYHFDVFGLIPKGLAIDINTLNK